MNAKEAVAARILALCKERDIAINALAGSAGVSPSTVYSMLNAKSQNPGVVSLQKLCDAFGITLADFFLDEPDALQLTEGQQEIITLYNNLSLEKKKILKA